MPVYFVQAGRYGPIKIGFAADPMARLAGLQTGHHERLELLATMAGGPTEESSVHHRFVKHRLRGEWFAPSSDLLEFIAENGVPVATPAAGEPGNEIREARRTIGLTQSQFGALLGVHQSQVSRWERGDEIDVRVIYATRWLLHQHNEAQLPGTGAA